MRAPALALLVAFGAMAASVACEESFAECYAGDYRACNCGPAQFGYQACSAANDYRSTSCVCDGRTPGLDAGPLLIADAAVADVLEAAAVCAADGGKAYFEDCTTSADCASCRCETFAGRGRCTTACTRLEDCASPADACTNRGVCRPPP